MPVVRGILTAVLGTAVLAATAFAGANSAATAAEAPAASFAYEGALEQGGWIRGKAPPRTVRLRMGNYPLTLDPQGRFFAAFDRDSAPSTNLVATLADGSLLTVPLAVARRNWQIEHVDVARKPGGASESFLARRQPELARIEAARAAGSDSGGWAQRFIWPVKGRISGRFGSQRIYRGEPAAYHSGLDIATGASGTPFVAPADGVVTLAATTPFSLEGYLLIIDHGNGLNSAFLHCSDIVVREGERVRQGQHIGNIGATGRATGPHLHWSMKWRDARLDPLLFTGPMD
ncbi:M23 family metallopeptidase [Parerythrobacter aurantius]|uniref:M23 family metallopeptidase n=1 Tax=Parerythrobacter aurantius TaxID=3127706 RepID=UPI003246AD96